MKPLLYALWAAAAGAGIPVMAVLNARLDRALGGASYAAMALFAVGFATTLLLSILLAGRWPDMTTLSSTRPGDFAGGVIVAGYIFSITMLAPRFGVANAILFVMTAQIFTSAAIDHFGLFGASVRPLTAVRALGLLVMLLGLLISQMAAQRGAETN